MARSEVCELCGSAEGVELIELPVSDGSEEQSIYVCSTCKSQIESGELDETHFNCLNDSMWSETPAVKVMSYILLNKLGRQDMVDMMYLEEDELKLAEQAINAEANKLVYKDCNGVELHAGDSIVIMKDLEVKGAGFTAKRGTTVTRISLAPNDPTHIEGRVNGTKIFLKTEFIKKA
ncbi:PhnA domain-containing protein [Sulfurimonas marina]|uniref:PhnA protein n=1 Tax=Sulfurimonas marina TaxID=2590551 RepID=A0A7M3V8Z0_9BACT|nr:alkylphosphonate utilization protein [Sulfurimonas marina]QOP40223.1 PhnA protein [Sulfurimonas marina]